MKRPKKYSDGIVKEIINNHYNVGSYLSHTFLETTDSYVHFVKTTKGKFVFKVLGQLDKKRAKFQGELTNFLKNRGFIVQNLIKNNKGEFSSKHDGFHTVLLNFIECKKAKISNKFVKAFGEEIVKIQNNLKKFDFKSVFSDTFEEHDYVTDGIKKDEFMKKEYESFLKIVKPLGKHLARGYVHADLNFGNLMVQGSRLVFLDWDCASYGYHLFDLAVFLSNLLIQEANFNSWKKMIIDLLKTYNKFIKLSKLELKPFYYLIKAHLFSFYSWHNMNGLKKGKDASMKAFKSLSEFSSEGFVNYISTHLKI